MQGGRKLSSWNIFVKKIYQEGRSNDKNYSFKQALTDASRRKGEMVSSTGMGTKKTMGKKGKKMSATRSSAMTGGRTRRRRRH